MQAALSRIPVALAAALALSACAGGAPPPSEAGSPAVAAPSGFGQRELSPQEKKVITDAVMPSLREPGSAKWRWAKFPVGANGAVNYCAMVNAKSPYPAYSGLQAYIVEANVIGGGVSSAVVGLIAGGKDTELVRRMCAKYGLDPSNAS